MYLFIFKISSQCPGTVDVDYSLHRIYSNILRRNKFIMTT